MVVPMSPSMDSQGLFPPEAAEGLVKLKWSLLGMILFGACRLLFAMAFGVIADLMGLLSVFLCIAMGIFMLKEDQHLQKFYKCLSTYPFRTCAERGMGGLSCLLP